MSRHGTAVPQVEAPSAPIKVGRRGGLASWPIRAKLGALVALPLVVIIGAGSYITAQSYYALNDARTAGRLATTANLTAQLTAAINQEDAASLAWLRTSDAAARASLDASRTKTVAAYAAVTASLESPPPSGWSLAVVSSEADLVNNAKLLTDLHAAVDSKKTALDALTKRFQSQLLATRALTSSLARGLSTSAPDGATVDGSSALTSLSEATSQASYEADILTVALASKQLLPSDSKLLQSTQAKQTDQLALAALHATVDQAPFISTLAEDTKLDKFRTAIAALAPGAITAATPAPPAVTADELATALRTRLAQFDAITEKVAQQLVDSSAATERSTLLRTLLAAALGLLSVLLVALSVSAIARTITGPMRRLRSGAVDAATVRLPAAVRQIEREGPDAAVAVPPVLPADAKVGPETREVAQALDGLTGEAVRLATSQVRLRQALDEAFVSMSRRSQSMVEKQLAIIDELESTEEDPEQLRNLFRLDHLAARMRRYNDNLLVLAGSTVRTRSAAPVPIADVFRAATSEMEQYERVRLQPLGGAMVTGAAAGGLIHLLAELLDNAAMYSPPTSPIVLSAAFTQDGGLHLEVTDSGVGIPAAELSDLNARLAMPGAIDTQVPSRMGLFVVARLAQRGGLSVRLAAREHSAGTVAEVSVPSSLVIGSSTGPIATVGQNTAAAMVTPAEPPRLPAQHGITATPLRGIQRPAAPRVAAAPRDPAPGREAVGADASASGPSAAPGGLPSRRPGAALAGNPLGANPLAAAAGAGELAAGDDAPLQTRAAHAGSLGRQAPVADRAESPSGFDPSAPWSDRANRNATPGTPPLAADLGSQSSGPRTSGRGISGLDVGRLPRRAPGGAPAAAPFVAPGSRSSDWTDPSAGRGAFEPQTPGTGPAPAGTGPQPTSGTNGGGSNGGSGGWTGSRPLPVRGPGQPGGGPALGPSAATAAAAAAAARNRGPISPPTSGLFAATGPLTRGTGGIVTGPPSGPVSQGAPPSPSTSPSAAATLSASTAAVAPVAPAPAATPAPPAPMPSAAPVAPAPAPAARQSPAAPPSSPAPQPPAPVRPASGSPFNRPAAPAGQTPAPAAAAPAAAAQVAPAPAAQAPQAPQAEPLPMEQAARQAAAASVARYRPIDPHAPMIGAATPSGERAPTPIFDSISVWFSDDRTAATTAAPPDPNRVIDLRDSSAPRRSTSVRPGNSGPDRPAESRSTGSTGPGQTRTTGSGAPGNGGLGNGGPGNGGSGNRWAALGDQRWVATNARASAAPQTAGSTNAGLPVRRPGANLLPSAATAAAPVGPVLPARRTDAESVRGRLGSYQRGLSSARRARHLPADSDTAAPFNPPPTGESDTGRRAGGQGGDS